MRRLYCARTHRAFPHYGMRAHPVEHRHSGNDLRPKSSPLVSVPDAPNLCACVTRSNLPVSQRATFQGEGGANSANPGHCRRRCRLSSFFDACVPIASLMCSLIEMKLARKQVNLNLFTTFEDTFVSRYKGHINNQNYSNVENIGAQGRRSCVLTDLFFRRGISCHWKWFSSRDIAQH